MFVDLNELFFVTLTLKLHLANNKFPRKNDISSDKSKKLDLE